MENLDYQTKTDGPAETLRSGDLFGQELQTYQPTMIQRPEYDWLNLQDIATECQRLCDAVTARMSADQPTDKQVWEMMKAHRAAVEALTRRPNDQDQQRRATGNKP